MTGFTNCALGIGILWLRSQNGCLSDIWSPTSDFPVPTSTEANISKEQWSVAQTAL